MPPALTHTDYSRARLLRLLEALDAAPQADAVTLALPSGFEPADLPVTPLRDDVRDALLDHAARSETGAFLFLAAARGFVVAPPFPIAEPVFARGYQTAPARSLLLARREIGVVLLRYGGWAVGVYDGDRLIDARNGGRFVKNRHRKGGQSQRRFERIREKQIDELFAQACAAATERLRGRTLDWIAYGGDRHTMQAFLTQCPALQALPAPVLPRFLTVPEPRHATLETLPVLLTTSRVTIWQPGGEGSPGSISS